MTTVEKISHVCSRLATARKILPGHKSIQFCGRRPKNSAVGVSIALKNTDQGTTARACGLGRCGGVWTCPECASIITETRSESLSSAITAWKKSGYTLSFLTLTIPHKKHQSLKELRGQFSELMNTMRSHRTYKQAADDYLIQGTVIAREVQKSRATGWHLHAHILIFTHYTDFLDGRAQAFLDAIFPLWKSLGADICGKAPNRKGQFIVAATSAEERIADYMSKFARPPKTKPWAVEREMTKSGLKSGRKLIKRSNEYSLSPFELLDACEETGEKYYAQSYLEYACDIKGERQLLWSRGLKERCRQLGAIINDRPDAEVANQDGTIEGEELAGTVSTRLWSELVKHNLEAEFVATCAKAPFHLVVDVYQKCLTDREAMHKRKKWQSFNNVPISQSVDYLTLAQSA